MSLLNGGGAGGDAGGGSGSGSSGNAGGGGGNGASGAGNGGAQSGGAGGSGGGGDAGGGASGGSATGTWRDSLPEAIRGHSAISSFKDMPALVQSFIHAQSKLGEKGVIPPKDWSKTTPEEKAEFYKSLGVPDKDKYGINFPKEAKLADEVQGKIKEFAREHGLLPHQAEGYTQALLSLQMENEKARAEATKSAQNAEITKLKEEWGDSFAARVASCNQLIKEVDPAFGEYIAEKGIGNDVNVIRFMEKASKKFLSETSLREGGIGNSAVSDQEARDGITQIYAEGDKNGFYDKSHPMHEVTMRKFEGFNKQLTRGR